ncbi:hypothetical protein [Coralloluteibacterium stylophorae]|uniref:Uncharacterized protein n=1 Tax=Coralloluteibacterium stylophorae TaxID=1776034 RepID=A0A8J7VUU9_9GAMM|nr:hypothetical protein [Coralloluteibacterium stylophorae]MBS7456767.1 hypothetical protein [Coralloluteibacterium stylophorae]
MEAATLTGANATADRIDSNRRKGSADNVTEWTQELRQTRDALVVMRAATMQRHARPVPLQPAARAIVVGQDGNPLPKSSLDTAFRRFMRLAMQEGVIAADERFSLHGIKHPAITDSADKRAGGHWTEAMRQRYDHELQVYDAPKGLEISGEFSGKGT